MTPPSSLILNKKDKAVIGLQIEKMVREQHLTYLEATTQFMEEHNIEMNQLNTYISTAIIDKIAVEAVESNQLRPSFAKTMRKNNLEDLF